MRSCVLFTIASALVLSPRATALVLSPHAPASAARARAVRMNELTRLKDQLAAVAALRASPAKKGSGADALWKVSGVDTGEPSFTRLFTHDTWIEYTGRPAIKRWWSVTITWPYSTVLKTVVPVSALSSLWAYAIARLPLALLPRTSPVPMSLMGTALGLLLVFRTNNSYLRLSEARQLWSDVIILVREIGQGVATALLHDPRLTDRAAARAGAANVCKYLAAFAWELQAKLTDADWAADTDVLTTLLPADEAEWIGKQRSRPLQLLGAIRRELHDQFRTANLPPHIHRKLEEDVRQLDAIVGSCERLFSSPLPPTMSRHIVRCLQLWLMGFPFVLAGTMAPMAVAVWVFVVSYAFIGIDEVGVQVEQPFEIVPMVSICQLAMANLEETFVNVPPGTFVDNE